MASSMITTTTWVRRGVAAQFPTKYEIDEEEINRISELARIQLEDAKGDLKAARGVSQNEEDKNGDAMEEGHDEKADKSKKTTT